MGQLRGRRALIVLLEPPAPAGFASGGYRYQERIFAHLAAVGLGQRLVVEPRQLAAAIAAVRARDPSAHIVVDGLFAERAAVPLPSGVIVLLHMVPSRADWCSRPMPVIATGEATAAAVAEQCSSVAVVRPGLDDCFRRSGARHRGSDGVVRIVCVGTVSPAKAQLRLVRALSALSSGWQLRLVGDVSTHPTYSAEVADAAARLPVELCGVLASEMVADTFVRSDLCVSLSPSESFGMAVTEAAACGLPVLALATGAIAEFVDHGKNGWLLPTAVDEEELRRLLTNLVTRPELLTAARAAARPSPLADWPTVSRHFVRACEHARP